MRLSILILVFFIPIIALPAGLTLAFTTALFFCLSIYQLRDKIQIGYQKINYHHYKLELAFLVYLLISIIWAPKLLASLASIISVIMFFGAFYLLIHYLDDLKQVLQIPQSLISTSLIIAIVIFYFEYFTNGLINTCFRHLVQNKADFVFWLHYLDRGMSFITMLAWIVIMNCISQRKHVLAITYYLIMLVTISLSDSLASLVAFITSGLVYLLTRVFTTLANAKVVATGLVLLSILFLVTVRYNNPSDLAQLGNSLPLSAKHRLFIWHYATNKVSEAPLFGFGHYSSRYLTDHTNETFDYDGHVLATLPIHPHNNLIQILLENGILGLCLYFSIMIKYLLVLDKRTASQNHIKSSGYAIFCCFFIISMISFNMWQSWWVGSYLLHGFFFLYFCSLDQARYVKRASND